MPPKLVLANNDGHGVFFEDRRERAWRSAAAIEAAIEGYRGSTLDALELCVSLGTKVNFLSDDFELFGTGGRTDLAPGRRGDRRVAELLGDFAAQGIDIPALVAQRAHDVGIRLHASIRMNPDYRSAWGEWQQKSYNDSFWWDNQRLRIRNRDGSVETHLSYAYPEMRERKLLLVRELLSRPVDGLNLDFLRHPPYVGYDQPLVASFLREHGLDPRELAEDDPRWMAHKCRPITEFLRAVRELAGDRTVSARVDHQSYLQRGLDIRRWSDERLLDILIVAEHGLGGYTFDLRPFVALAGDACKVLFGEEAAMSGHDLTPEEDRALATGRPIDVSRRIMTVPEYCRRALDWFAQGADGVHVFNDAQNYELFKLLGDPERCRAVVEQAGHR